MAPVKAGHVRLVAVNDDLQVEVRLDDQAPKMTGGYGGLARVERRYRLPIVEWTGNDVYAMSIGLLFDGWLDRRPVDDDINVLEQMARAPGGESEPPIVRAIGPLPRSQRVRWRIEQIDFGDPVIWQGRRRLRQQATVTLIQHEADERLRRLKRPKPRTVRVQQGGQSAEWVAHNHLGSGKRWKEIKRLNPKKVKGPKQKIKGGTVLRIPPR